MVWSGYMNLSICTINWIWLRVIWLVTVSMQVISSQRSNRTWQYKVGINFNRKDKNLKNKELYSDGPATKTTTTCLQRSMKMKSYSTEILKNKKSNLLLLLLMQSGSWWSWFTLKKNVKLICLLNMFHYIIPQIIQMSILTFLVLVTVFFFWYIPYLVMFLYCSKLYFFVFTNIC